MANFVRDEGQGGSSFARLAVWIILGVLALAFGLSFGLPSDSLTFGPQSVASVHGEQIQREDFTYQTNITASVIQLPEDERYRELMGIKEEILEAIVERYVYEDLAQDLGLALETRDAEELTYKGHLILMGDTLDWLGDTPFNYDKVFQNFILGRFAVSEQKYLEAQRQELLARTVRDLIGASTAVSDTEMRAVYEERENQISIRYVRLPTRRYAELVDPTPEEVEAFVKANQSELSARYDAQAARFLKLPPQVRLRLIRVGKPPALPEDADEDTRKEHDRLVEEAKTTIKKAVSRLDAGDTFPVVAREMSDDVNTARGGGDYGWVSVEGTGSGLEGVLDEAAAKLEDGQRSDVIEGEEAFYVIRVEGHREGDVAKEAAMAEIAFDGVRAEAGSVQAKQAAQEALLRVKEGEKLADIFKVEDNPIGGVGGGIESLPLGELGGPAADDRPRVQVTGLFAKGKPIPGLGANAELSTTAWDAEVDTMIDEVFEIDDGYVIAGVEEKKQATDDGFKAARADLFDELTESKNGKLAAKLAHRRCLESKGRGEIKPNGTEVKRLITYSTKESYDEEGNRVVKPYSMCDRVGNRGGMMRVPAAFAGGR